MPGIVGIVAKMPAERAVPRLIRMVEMLRHESFYVEGTWFDESSGFYAGWVARKDSFSAQMPVSNEAGDIVLVFSGEEFPDPHMAQRLKEQGHRFDLAGPSYLVHLYEEDPSFPANLNGQFQAFLVDRRRGIAALFNDRYGMHRIYWHQSKDAFYFASEAKALLAVCPELREMDYDGLGEFLTCGAVLENRTLFKDIHLLPPASIWAFKNGSLQQKGIYFQQAEWENQGKLDLESYYSELREVFARNLPRYFSGPHRVAMSLTGGLDTRMIMAWHKPRPGSMPCYTFGSMLRENQDVRVARQVAKMCRQTHHVIAAGQEFLSRFPRYADRAVYLSDGCVDVGRAPDLYLNEIARKVAPVRMSGNYGGEVLRGVRAFKAVRPKTNLFCPELLPYIDRAAATYEGIICNHPVSFAVFRQGPWYHTGVLALEQTQLTMRTPFLDNDFVRTVFRAPASTLASNEVSLRLIGDGTPALAGIPTDRGFAGDQNALLGSIARGYLEFLFKAEYAYDIGMPQWLARVDHALSSFHLEQFFLGRHKVFHFRRWYRDSLATYIQEILLDPKSLARPYIDSRGLEAVVQGHVKGNRNYTTELHKVLTLELFHRLFIDSSARWDSIERSNGSAHLTELTRPVGAPGGVVVPLDA